MIPFPHLNVHSYYTLLGATASPEQLAQRAADEGMTSLALTDTNVLYGAVAFDRACRAAGIRPIIGMTVTVAWPDAIEAATPDAGTAGQLVLLARNSAGYRSLCRLTGLIQGSADREAQFRQGLAAEQLRANAGGLICLTGGRRGFSYRCSATNDAAHDRAAHRFLGRLCGIYGPEHMFVSLELQTPEDLAVAHRLSEKAAFLGLNTVAVHPIFTLVPDETRLRLLAAIDHNCSLGEVPPEALPYGGDGRVAVRWLSTETLSERYAAPWRAPAMSRRSARIGRFPTARCNGRRWRWPAGTVPPMPCASRRYQEPNAGTAHLCPPP
ncbi:MAG: PHP domain-containing protein [Anaerolineae bacterium]|nr:PHP domain-containing protein [Anaerolineae bacterium]